MDNENLEITPNANDPPSVNEYSIDGQKFTVTRYYSGGKNIEDIITELACRQADRDFKINTSKDLKS